jgi:hypothetical protein
MIKRLDTVLEYLEKVSQSMYHQEMHAHYLGNAVTLIKLVRAELAGKQIT